MNGKPFYTLSIPYVKGFSDEVRRVSSKYKIRNTFKYTITLKEAFNKLEPKNLNCRP